MERSSRQTLRSERIAGSPYRRPPSSGLTKSHSTTFSTVKSFFSRLTPFRSSSTDLSLPLNSADLPIQVEDGSISGSEDEWNGAGPSGSNGTHVIDVAHASDEYEEQSAEWRAKGEKPGGRRDTARRASFGLPPLSRPTIPSTPVTPFTNGLKGTNRPSNGFNSSSAASKRPIEAVDGPSDAIPTPSFLPPSANSASSAALKAYLDAKKGQTWNADDNTVVQALVGRIGTEGTPKDAEKYGGWSAGTPRSNRSFVDLKPSTPARNDLVTPFNTPGSAFSIGTPAGTPGRTISRSVRYLGPGMSPRGSMSKRSLVPLFNFNFDADTDESATKKRKVEGREPMDVDGSPKAGLSVSMSMPNLANASMSKLDQNKTRKTDAHPLRQSSIPEPAPTPQSIGKQRSVAQLSNILKEYDAPKEAAKAKGALTSDVVINNYADSTSEKLDFASASPRAATPGSAERRMADASLKSCLRASTRGETPTRGSARKLLSHRSREVAPTPTRISHQKSVSFELPEKEQDQMAIEDLFGDEEVSTPASEEGAVEDLLPKHKASAPAPPAQDSRPRPSAQSEASEKPFTFEIPDFAISKKSAPTTNSSAFGASPVGPASFGSPSRDLTLESVTSQQAAPKFTPVVPSPLAREVEETTLLPRISKPVSQKSDASKLYHTAKDAALNVPKESLPFYTFTIPASTKSDTTSVKAAKEAASKAALSTFVFTLDAPAAPAPAPATAFKPFDFAGAGMKPQSKGWTCDLCCLTNSDDAATACSICEARRPGAAQAKATAAPAPAAPAPTQAFKPFDFAAAGMKQQSTGWTCGLCGLSNSDDAATACSICESPRV